MEPPYHAILEHSVVFLRRKAPLAYTFIYKNATYKKAAQKVKKLQYWIFGTQ